MKKNVITFSILIALFFFGLLIYDFSDELSSDVTNHDWYRMLNGEIEVIRFKNREFSYYYENDEKPVTIYDLCLTYRFNRSINVIKLNCAMKDNELHIIDVNDHELNIIIEGEEKTFYANKELAIKEASVTIYDLEHADLILLD